MSSRQEEKERRRREREEREQAEAGKAASKRRLQLVAGAVLGIVAIAAGVEQAVEQPASSSGDGTTAAAVLLAVGAALFLAGDVAFRRLLRIGPVGIRALAGLAVLATIAVGVSVTIEAQLAAVTVLLSAMLVIERRRAGGRPPTAGLEAG